MRGSSAAPPVPPPAPPRHVRVPPAFPSAPPPVPPNGWDDDSPGQPRAAPAGGGYGSWGGDGAASAMLSALLPAACGPGGWGGEEGSAQGAAANPRAGGPHGGWGGEEGPSQASGPARAGSGGWGAGVEADASWLVGSPEQPRNLSAPAPLPANGRKAPGALHGSGMNPKAKPFVGVTRPYNPINPSLG